MSDTKEITNYTDFIPTNLNFTEVTENERSNGQSIAYPRYNSVKSGADSALILQGPWIKLDNYGVPKLNQYYKTDEDRAHIRLPLDESNPENAVFAQKIKDLDEIMKSSKMMEKLFGKKASKYKYSTIFREGQEVDEDAKTKDGKPVGPRPPYIKVKLDLTWPEKNVKSVVYDSELNKETNKRTRTKVENINTIDDFAKAVPYLSNVRVVIRPVKLWAHAANKKDPEFGITFKLIKIEVENSRKGTNVYKNIHDSDNFIDSDSEEDLPMGKTVFSAATKAAATNEDDSSSDDEDSEPVKKSQSAPSKLVEVDSSSEDDEPAPKQAAKTKKAASVEEDSSEEDEPAPKPAAKTKKAAPVEEDSSEEDEPAPKPASKTKKAATAAKKSK
uniref:Uncharacterized protein n=1 Tax=viral metagenome TaxID=1070528 RepID=A0A6C0D9T4_9ZZZZ